MGSPGAEPPADPVIPLKPVTEEDVKGLKKNELKQKLKESAVKLYEEKETEFPQEEQIRELERVILLKVIDQKWMDHIDDMDQLRQGIGLQAYGQRDPKVEYKMAAYDMFKRDGGFHPAGYRASPVSCAH